MSAYTRLLLACVSLASLWGCSEPQQDSNIRSRGFVYCGQDTPNTFNPQLTDGGLTADTLAAQIFDRLLLLDPVTHRPLPSLAKSWTMSGDGLTYTFSLREGIAFQSTDWFKPTRQFNAQDVVFSFKRVIDPSHPFHAVSGGRYPWFESQGFANLIDDITIVDPYTVQFSLTRPDNAFLANLATTYAVIHSQEYADQVLRAGKPDQLDHLPIGTGPFSLEQYLPNDLVRLNRHNGYWQGAAKMEQVVFDIASRGTGSLAKLLSKECDVLSSPVASQLPIINDNEDFDLTAQTGMNVAYLAIDTNKPALKDLRVRQAINHAINRDNLLSSVYYGTGTEAHSILPPMSWAYHHNSEALGYDPEKALQLLKEAGFDKNLSLTLWVPLEPRPYNPSPRKTAELIQADLNAVGVQVNIIMQDSINRFSNIDKFNSDLILTGWIADNGDPDNFLRPLLSCDAKAAGLNDSNWCNLDFDNLLELASRTSQLNQRLNFYQRAQAIVDQDVPVVPLAHGVHFQIHHNSLKGLQMSPFGTRSFSTVYRSEP
ncbi:ABC transporter substrate-binding protein SapA [Photobacterium aphoticum]|uniref:ABC transporter substrate-binding protein n=1 Tax=Photobacterium aphoticum TaxID=754436 RepID=A0A0J1GKW6_9GAMM|nr:ABC transporter substrate-binding protein SapA [Photobacterium aphoticum]KLV00246.1 ABC transporter substrate-binding protein [Photobacterium aphoticum]PSU56614.1 peptide ABC transporter substrate-binding protein SapA [Photobacterium aphoticum]GHA55772.1 ABC transporter substrate-binding protein [Photobacterium aphoticum]